MIIHSAKETRKQKEQRTGELEKTLKRVGMQYRGGLNKIGG